MLLGSFLLLLCSSQLVWAEQQTDDSHGVIPQQLNSGDGGQKVSPLRRTNRAAQGGGVTINTLPDNVTHVVVSAAPHRFLRQFFEQQDFHMFTAGTLPLCVLSETKDSNRYYTWRSFGPEDQRTHDLWFDMSDVRHGQVRVHSLLSNSYKQAVRVVMSFDFPFYGHYLKQIIIATGGFIFTGDVTHRMLTTTQYIAPLMANFDPGHSKESTVQYLDNGEVFVVQWERVRLPGEESQGAFTFQAALYKTGRITFSYRDIPLPLDVIGSADQPVKVGLSDAFTVRSSSSQSPVQQMIHEYHRVELDVTKITNNSAVELTPLPTCLLHDSCELCLSSNQTSGCSWCNVLQRCSDGMDRHRQEWLDYSCSEESKDATCDDYFRDDSFTPFSAEPEAENPTSETSLQNGCDCGAEGRDDTRLHTFRTGSAADVKTGSSVKNREFSSTAVVAGIVAALVLLLALVLVAVFIHCHPAASPLHLIQRRSSYWPSLKFQKQQSGYTEVDGEGYDKFSIVEAGAC